MVVVELSPAGHLWLSTTSSATILHLSRPGWVALLSLSGLTHWLGWGLNQPGCSLAALLLIFRGKVGDGSGRDTTHFLKSASSRVRQTLVKPPISNTGVTLIKVGSKLLKGCLTVGVTRKWAGWDSAWEQEKLEARKMLENAAESHLSGARFVGLLFDCRMLCHHQAF